MVSQQCIEMIENEFSQIEENKAWNQIYQKIRDEGTYDFECSAAKVPSNKKLNRYVDVLPYDTTRIKLKGTSPDYINASLVEVESIGRKYILSQGPLAHTTSHFWLMTWQQKSRGIIMLNKIMEKNQIKCHQYWPLGEKRGGETCIEFPSVSLKVDLLKEITHSSYVYRTFRLTNTLSNESREVLHFHYTTWPDFGVPQSPEAFFKFLNVVRQSQCLESKYGPAIIHCSAGIGRSGTFCLVDSVLIMISRDRCSNVPGKILEVLLDMRKFRMGLIQTADQLKFSYQAIIYGIKNIESLTGQDPSEESSSEEVSQDEPPPLPPPRIDSLSRSMTESEVKFSEKRGDVDNDNSSSDSLELDEDQQRIARGIYQRNYDDFSPKSSGHSEQNESGTANSVQHSTESANSELRQRRQQRKATTAKTIQEIKEKAKAAEQWSERKKLLLHPISFCFYFILAGLGGGIVFYYQRFNS